MTRFASPLPLLVMFVLLVPPVAGALLGGEAASAQALERTMVSAAGYPAGVRFIEADERAFLDPVAAGVSSPDEPERLAVPPAGFVPRVEVRSGLWARLAEAEGLTPVEDVADYDSQAALVRLRHVDGTASWWALDGARASMLTRYARIGRGGRTGAEPTTLQVLREMRRWRESVVIDVEGFEIEPRRWDQRLLWNEFERATALDVSGAQAGMSLDAFDVPFATVEGGDGVRVTFRLLDGRALPFVYLPGPSLLVDVSRIEVEAGGRAPALPAFEVSPSVAVTLERIVATKGAPLADGASERLAEGVEDIVPFAAQTSSTAAAATPAAVGTPAPRVLRSFNEGARVVVRTVDSEATTFAALLVAVVASAAVAGAVARRGASAR